jgi:hypothetical protein
MPYHGCNYLFLHDSQKSVSGNTITWNNLPVLSGASRECYITIIDCKLILSNGSTESINVKMDIPVRNYYSSSNLSPVAAILHSDDAASQVYDLQHTNDVHLLSNDNLQKIKFELFDNAGGAVTTADTLEVMLKIEYIDQEKLTENFLSDIPKHLGGL